MGQSSKRVQVDRLTHALPRYGTDSYSELDNSLNSQVKSPASQMADTANNTAEERVITEEDHSLNTRIFRAMIAVTAVAVIVSSLLGSLRFTTGLLIGGVLAIFSHNWLRNSAGAAINLAIGEGVHQLRLMQFLLRYLVIGLVVFAAYVVDIASLTAMLLGLSSFVVALLIEAIREFYFAIIPARGN